MSEDQGLAGEETVEIETDFDFKRLEEIFKDLFGEEEGNAIASSIANAMGDGTSVKDLRKIDGQEFDEMVFPLAMRVVSQRQGNDGFDQVVRKVSAVTNAAAKDAGENPAENPIPIADPSTDKEAYNQTLELRQWLHRVFEKDPQMKRAVDVAFDRVIADSNYSTLARSQRMKGEVNRAALLPENLISEVEQVLDMMDAGEVKNGRGRQQSPYEARTDEEVANDDAFLETLLQEYASGRHRLPFDDERRDPTGVVTAYLEESGSSLTKDTREPGFETREVSFFDPYQELDLDSLMASDRTTVENLLNSDAYKRASYRDAQTMLQNIMETTGRRVFNQLWNYSPLDAMQDIDPSTLANTSEFFTKSFLDEWVDETVTRRANALFERGGANNLLDFGSDKWKSSFSDFFKAIKGDAQEMMERRLEGARPKDSTEVPAHELQAFINEMPDERFRQIQLDLWFAGAYEETSGPVPWGDRADDVAWNAWNQAIADASRLKRRGQSVRVEDIFDILGENGLSDRRKAIDDDLADAQANLALNLSTIPIDLTDPAALIEAADIQAKSLLGRNATPEERRMLVSIIHSGQRNAQTKRARAIAGAESRKNIESALRDKSQLDFDVDKAIAESKFGLSPLARKQLVEGGDAGLLAGMDVPLDREMSNIRERHEVAPGSDTVGAPGPTGPQEPQVSFEEFVGYDPQARMRQFLMENNAEEVQTKELRSSFNTFLQALRTPIGG